MEYLDIYDANFCKIGSCSRQEAHNKGHWHQSFHCWIFNKKGSILFQKRLMDGGVYEGKLDISVAGHLSAGEDTLDGVREIKEELGLNVNKENLFFLGRDIQMFDALLKNGIFVQDREFVSTFLLIDETAPEKCILQPEEVAALYQIPLSDAFNLFSGQKPSIKIKGFKTNNSSVLIPDTLTVNISDFAARGTNYYLKILIMIERYLKGEKYLAV